MALSFDKVNKIITVLAPETEITIQNLLNSIREYEDELTTMDMPFIASCAGNEPLGGGVVVGLTLTLLDDWQLAFEARSGPQYIQCKVSGGNIVATNTNGSIYPTAFTQVLITASSSATQADLAAIQYASFGGGVSVDITSGNSGIDYPVGNQEYPVNNMENAVTIAQNNGFLTAFIRKSMPIEDVDISNFNLVGLSDVNTAVYIADSAVCSGVMVNNCNVTGVLDGGTHIHNCYVGTITYVNGHIRESGLYGIITLDGNQDAVIEACHTIDQDNYPIIDMGGSGQSLAMPNYSGIVTIRNLNAVDNEVGIGLSAGLVIIEDTVTAGTMIISGSGLLTDNSTGTAYVNSDGLMNRELITKSSWDTVYYDYTSTNSGTLFPIGTLTDPSNNLTDLLTIAAENSIYVIKLKSDLTLDQDVSGYVFDGSTVYTTNLNGQLCLNSQFNFMAVTGVQTAKAKFDSCKLSNIQGLSGIYKDCAIPSTVPMTVASGADVFMTDCRSAVPGNSSPVIDFSNGGIGFNCRAYSGGIRIINSTDATNVSTFEFIAGKFNFGVDNTAGEFHVRGVIDTTGININSTADVHYTGSVTTNREMEYGGVVHLDMLNGVSGAYYPIGITSEDSASNNLTDALSIAHQFDCSEIMLNGSLTITAPHDVSNITIKAARSLGNYVLVESGATTSGTYFENLTVAGVMDGSVRYTTSVLGAITNFDGGAKNCLLTNDIIFTGNSSNYLTECDTYVTSSSYVSLYTNQASLNIMRGRGRWGIFDKVSTNTTAIDLVSGFVYVDSTCISGIVNVGGIGSVEDNSDVGCQVNQGSINNEYMADAVWNDDIAGRYSINSSATALKSLTYDAIITINTVSGTAGTSWPIGTRYSPVNNLTDALTIMDRGNVDILLLESDLIVGATADISGFLLETQGLMGTTVTLDEGCRTDNTAFRYINLEGTLTPGDSLLVENCSVLSLANFTGIMNNVAFGQGSEISLAFWAEIIQGTAGGDPTNEVELDIGTASLNMSGWTGSLKLKGKTGVNRVTVNCSSGNVIIDSTCVSGTIQLLGVGQIEQDNSGPNCTVDTDAFISRASIAVAVWDENLAAHLNDASTGHALMHQTYEQTLFIDTINGTDGIIYPAGIRQEPVKTLADALVLINTYELNSVHVIGSLLINGGEDISGLTFLSDRSIGNSVTVSSAITNNTYFENLTVSGTMAGVVRYTTCVLGTINGFDGGAKNSLLTSDINITGNGANYFTECDTYITDSSTFKKLTIADKLVNIIRCRGNYEIAGKISTGTTAIDLVAGIIKIDSDCTAGEVFVAGIGEVVDNSSVGCIVVDSALARAAIVDDVWNETLDTHTTFGTFGAELATKADIAASTSTDRVTVISGSVIYGSQSGDFTDTYIRDNSYLEITEDATTGITVEMLFEVPSSNHRPGTFSVFGHYIGLPTSTHHIELKAYNYESNGWETLQEEFLPGGNTSDTTAVHEYYERHVDRVNEEVKIRLVHHVTTYNASHVLYLDYIEASFIEVVTAEAIADAVWDEPNADHLQDGSTGKALSTASTGGVDIDLLAAAVWDSLAASYTISGTMGSVMNNINSSGEYDTALDEIKTNLDRVLGLSQENYELSDMVYTTYSGIQLLESSTIRIYSDPLSVGGVDDIIATYNIESNWTADQLTNYKVTRI